jgi:Transglycosylase-like domain
MLSKWNRPLSRAIVLSLISISIPTIALPSFASPVHMRSPGHLSSGIRPQGASPFEWHVPTHHHTLTLARVAHLGGIDWLAIARCESGLRWHIADSPFYGGLQFMTSTWISNGGRRFASRADRALPAQQVVIAYHLAQRSGLRSWPVCGSRG